jgi:hypothetical protein
VPADSASLACSQPILSGNLLAMKSLRSHARGGNLLLRQIRYWSIFIGPSIARAILGGTISSRTYMVTDGRSSTTVENASWPSIATTCSGSFRGQSRLTPRQRGWFWYSTFAVEFAGDYTYRNAIARPQTVDFRLKFPAQKATEDGADESARTGSWACYRQ